MPAPIALLVPLLAAWTATALQIEVAQVLPVPSLRRKLRRGYDTLPAAPQPDASNFPHPEQRTFDDRIDSEQQSLEDSRNAQLERPLLDGDSLGTPPSLDEMRIALDVEDLRIYYRLGDHGQVALYLARSGPHRGRLVQDMLEEEIRSNWQNSNKFIDLLHALSQSDVPSHHAATLYTRNAMWAHSQAFSTSAWNLILRVLCRHGELEQGWSLLQEMIDEHGRPGTMPPPDEESYLIVIRAAAMKFGSRQASDMLLEEAGDGDGGRRYHLEVMRACILDSPPNFNAARFYLRKFEEQVQKRMSSVSAPPALLGYNMLIAAYVWKQDLREAFAMLGTLKSRGIVPNDYTYQVLSQGCLQAGADGVQRCRQLLQQTLRMGMQPRIMTYNALMHGYVRTGQLDSTLQLAKKLSNLGLAWDRITFSLVITALCASGRIKKAVCTLRRMRRVGMRPTKQQCLLVSSHLAQQGYSHEALRVLPEIMELMLQEVASDEPEIARRDCVASAWPRHRQPEGLRTLKKLPQVPPHVLGNAFGPGWQSAPATNAPQRCRDMIIELFMQDAPVASECINQVLREYYHATRSQRGMLTLNLPWSTGCDVAAMVRTAGETQASLRQLFENHGWPGQRATPAYIFTCPTDCSLDAMLWLLAFAACHPTRVILLRPHKQEVVAKQLRYQCFQRRGFALWQAVSTLLASLSSSIMINRKVLLASGAIATSSASPSEFESALRAAIAAPAPKPIAVHDQGDETWKAWLRRQGLQSLVRCTADCVRLDGTSHEPTVAKAELFRIRPALQGRVAVDLWLDAWPWRSKAS